MKVLMTLMAVSFFGFMSDAAVFAISSGVEKKSIRKGASEELVKSQLPENVVIDYQDITGIGYEENVCRRDPSDIIKVNDTYYVWYTKLLSDAPLYPNGYYGTIWYATSTDGIHWKEQGEAVGKGPTGTFDSFGVYTPNILVFDGKYYLSYDSAELGFTNNGYSEVEKTMTGIAVSDSPDGPWIKPKNNIILQPSPDSAKFDSFRVCDSCFIVRDGMILLYYKGRQWGFTPETTCMGAAMADNPLGPFNKLNDGNCVQDSGHEVMVWPYKGGVLSMTSSIGPHGRSLFYANDGIDFKVVGFQVIPSSYPIAPGSFRQDFSGFPNYDEGIEWGICIARVSDSHPLEGPHPYLVRFACNLKK